MRKTLFAATAALAIFAAGPANAASYIYVGSFTPSQGPYWGTNPLAYSGVGAASFLFGGSASQYAVSTVDNNPANINHMANYEMIGRGSRVFADNFFRGVEGVTHYQDVYLFDETVDTVSTYVSDFGNNNVNYVFRVADAAVPEPATWGMLILGFGAMGVALRRRGKQQVRVRYAA